MRLEVASYEVKDVRLGARTALLGGVLEVGEAELRERLCEDPVLADVRVELARPGDSTRVVHVLDTVEPRVRIADGSMDFPGFLGPPTTVGEGRTNRLAGVAVMEVAALPLSLGGLNVKEAIVDMTGPAAALTPFSRTLNVVLVCTVRDGFSYREYDESIRRAGLKAAVYLAEASRAASPDRIESLQLVDVDADLPRVAYMCLLMQEADVHHMFLYGRSIEETPSLLHPNECLDGAIVSGDHHMAAHRNPTYFHQNNPVIRDLYRRHGRDLAFRGVIVTKCLNESFFAKQRTASYAAKLARLLGAQGVVITAGTSGHGVADLMLHCDEAERAGLRTAMTCFEMAGDEGAEFGFVTFSRKADAVVSTGNMDAMVELPSMQRVIGGEAIIDIGNYEGGGGARADGALQTALRRVYACACLVGPGHMTARAS